MEKREAELRSIFKAIPTGVGMVVNRVITWVNGSCRHHCHGIQLTYFPGQPSS
ncbi:hypothetical protein [Desulfocicer niacini]